MSHLMIEHIFILFSFFQIDKLLPKYMDSYDIVLVSDETMNVSISLLKHILK